MFSHLFVFTHISLFTIFLEDSSILFPIFSFFGQEEMVQKQSKSSKRRIKQRNVYTIVEWMSINNKQTPTTTDVQNGAQTLRVDQAIIGQNWQIDIAHKGWGKSDMNNVF